MITATVRFVSPDLKYGRHGVGYITEQDTEKLQYLYVFPNNLPQVGQVIKCDFTTNPKTGEPTKNVDHYEVVDGSATPAQASNRPTWRPAQAKAPLPAGALGQIKGMILNNAVQMSISKSARTGDTITLESITEAAELVAEARKYVDAMEITS